MKIIKTLKDKYDDYKAKKYITQMRLRHPEFKNYTLDFDYKVPAEFNKELLIRSIVAGERSTMSMMFAFKGLPISQDDREISPDERFYACCKIGVMINEGYVDPITFKEKEEAK